MKEINLKKISFWSYIKLNVIAALGTGILFGIFCFVLSLLGANVYATIGQTTYTGLTAGIINIFLAPFVMVFIFFFFSMLLYLGLLLYFKLKKTISLKVEMQGRNKE